MPGPAPGPGGRQGGAGEDPGAGGQHEGQAGGRQGARHPGCRHQVGWRTVLHCILVLLILISLFRIQQLTASLMSKQSILERVTSERTSLAYRLERLEVRTGGLITDNILSSSSEAGVRGAECGETQQEGRGGPGPGHCLHGGQLRSCMLAPWRICAYMHTICKYSLHISVEKDVPH